MAESDRTDHETEPYATRHHSWLNDSESMPREVRPLAPGCRTLPQTPTSSKISWPCWRIKLRLPTRRKLCRTHLWTSCQSECHQCPSGSPWFWPPPVGWCVKKGKASSTTHLENIQRQSGLTLKTNMHFCPRTLQVKSTTLPCLLEDSRQQEFWCRVLWNLRSTVFIWSFAGQQHFL